MRGQHHPTVAIGGMGLRAIRDGPTFLHRPQPGQSLLRCRIDPLVIRHGRYDLAPGGVFHLNGADHVTMVESSAVLQGVLVLLVAHVRYCVLLFQGDAVLHCDVLCRLEHGIARIGVEVETILDPVLACTFASRSHWVRIVEVRSIARLITGDSQDAALSVGLDFIGSASHDSRRSGTCLADRGPRETLGSKQYRMQLCKTTLPPGKWR